jgi:hypothetical protein
MSVFVRADHTTGWPNDLVMLGSLVPVVSGLVGTLNWDADVVSLRLGELCKLGTKLAQMESSNLLIKVLREHVHLLLILARALLLPQLKLSDDLSSSTILSMSITSMIPVADVSANMGRHDG